MDSPMFALIILNLVLISLIAWYYVSHARARRRDGPLGRGRIADIEQVHPPRKEVRQNPRYEENARDYGSFTMRAKNVTGKTPHGGGSAYRGEISPGDTGSAGHEKPGSTGHEKPVTPSHHDEKIQIPRPITPTRNSPMNRSHQIPRPHGGRPL
eukprot:GEMP01041531.1.p1 GENE.GEMP01041531.1~~GEMP01041531.1.p1  ORF type:complete len:154 (+),score=15.93 GEMP01041531.1:458-919(+)